MVSVLVSFLFLGPPCRYLIITPTLRDSSQSVHTLVRGLRRFNGYGGPANQSLFKTTHRLLVAWSARLFWSLGPHERNLKRLQPFVHHLHAPLRYNLPSPSPKSELLEAAYTEAKCAVPLNSHLSAAMISGGRAPLAGKRAAATTTHQGPLEPTNQIEWPRSGARDQLLNSCPSASIRSRTISTAKL